MDEKSGRAHIILKIEMLPKLANPGELECFLRRNERFALVCGQVQKDIGSMNNAISQYSAATDRQLEEHMLKVELEVMQVIANAKRVSSSLISHSQEQVAALNTMKNDLEAQT